MGFFSFFNKNKKLHEATLFHGLDIAKKGIDKETSNISSTEIQNKLSNAKMSDLEISATEHYAKGDFSKAFLLYEELSILKPAEGLYSLGTCYLQGKGTEVNHTKAFDLFSQATALNYPKAMVSLALCYQMGYGISVNQKKSMELEDSAISLNEPFAYFYRAIRYNTGTGVKKNLNQTFKYLSKANIPIAFYSLGYMYKNGLGTEINHQEAFKFFKKSSESGDPRGMGELINYYYHIKYGNYDKSQALYWAEKIYSLSDILPKMNIERAVNVIKILKS